ncbi:hypothetical protein CK3_25630 [butyrate-producing bacterium SS3/4]|jgi:hypothetical protein|nr:hypothetical protein CK3_25630 [butyrate-producing bacterium SS3/4]DAU09598.1 MAG TPA: hypothetical protein [Caudoviricetes sp.]DAZ51304.1 MAG TPA: hypothetical protein [Caudoviricetes sp.]
MEKYDFDSMGALWADQARKIVENGVFVANSGGWDLWAYDGTVYSIPVNGSGGSASYWCALSQLRAHLFRLRTICRYNALIPDGWKNINREFLAAYGIA